MRRSVQYALVAVIVLLTAAASMLYVKYRSTYADYTDVKAKEQMAESRYARTIDAIAEIQDSLNAISVGERSMESQALEKEQSLSGGGNQRALDRIAMLRASILRNRNRIRQLETSLKTSGIRIGGLQKMIARLKETAQQKEILVAHLAGKVDSLQTEVTGLATVVAEKEDTLRVRDQTLEDRRRELATVYYVVGNKKQLTATGIVEAKGGVLGVGTILTPSGTPDPSKFIPLDTDQADYVRTYAKKAKVLSAQPHSSYEMLLEDGQVVLHIVNPVEFRKIKQLVIVTA